MTVRQKLLLATLLGFALATGAAAADPVGVVFRVAPMSGPLAGSMTTGIFTYDTSVAPTAGGTVAATGLVSDLAFTFNGVAFDESTANTGSLTFDAARNLVLALFGTDCGNGFCNLTPGTNDFLVSTGFDFPGLFAYATPGSEVIFSGDAFLFARAVVPEPTTLPLLLAGSAAAVFALRHRRAMRR